MADMDTIVLRNRENEYVSVTLGPEGHKLSKFEISRMVLGAIKDVQAGNGEEVDLSY
jgi:hypothetical protein